MGRLVLCGTVHDDYLGPQRLITLLHDLNPKFISLEKDERRFCRIIRRHRDYSRLTAEERQRSNREMVPAEFHSRMNWEHYDLARLMNGFEDWVSAAYHGTRGAGILMSERPDSESLAPKSVPLVWEQEWERYFCNLEEHGKRVEEAYTSSSHHRNDLSDEFVRWCTIREKAMAKALSSVLRGFPNATIVHLSGAAHIFGNAPNLYTMLRKFNPIRLKLNEMQISEGSADCIKSADAALEGFIREYMPATEHD